MQLKNTRMLCAVFIFGLMSSASDASEGSHDVEHKVGPACEGFGPQTPRDIDSKKGVNPQIFSLAAKSKKHESV